MGAAIDDIEWPGTAIDGALWTLGFLAKHSIAPRG
jgi:hypothetical protein